MLQREKEDGSAVRRGATSQLRPFSGYSFLAQKRVTSSPFCKKARQSCDSNGYKTNCGGSPVTPRSLRDAALFPAREKHRLACGQALLFRLRLAKSRPAGGCSLYAPAGAVRGSLRRCSRLLGRTYFITFNFEISISSGPVSEQPFSFA